MKYTLVKRCNFIGTADYETLSADLWAAESLVQLQELMVMKNLCNTNYSNEFASYGDLVKIDVPGEFEWHRMHRGDRITDQEGTASYVQVPMDQLFDTSFLLYDTDKQKSFKDLVQYRMKPALRTIAEGLESSIIGQVARMKSNVVGKLGTAITYDGLVDVATAMSDNNIPFGDRHIVMSPKTQGDILKIDELTLNSNINDGGQALREARIGQALGFNLWMSQMVPQVASGATTSTGAVNLSAGYAAGTATMVVDGITGAIGVGTWCTIAGDMIPHVVTARTLTSTDTTGITISPALNSAVVNDAVITFYTPGAVNLSAGYAAGWAKGIAVDGFTVAPKKGQMVNFGVNANTYTITSVRESGAEIWLDRPLDASIANDALVCVSPTGHYNMAFNRNAIAVVNRPLRLEGNGNGVSQAWMATEDEGFSVRVTIGYDMLYKATRVSIDTLFGIQVLDADQAFLFCS